MEGVHQSRLVLIGKDPEVVFLAIVLDRGQPLAIGVAPGYPLVGGDLTKDSCAIAKTHQNSEMKPWAIWL